MPSFNHRLIITILLVLLAMISIGESVRIQAKAMLSQILIEQAWEKSMASGADVSPWHWADTFPVARLKFDRLDKSVIVLAGANGGALPFGPSHVDGTAYPGENGTSVIAGHRDTHFRWLKDAEVGDTLSVQTRAGNWVEYAIEFLDVIDTRDYPVWSVALARNELQLITCYPFDVPAGGPLRYIVSATRTTPDNIP